MTPADFVDDVRALATCKRSEELEQRVARLAVRMETCKQETCAPIDVDLEGEITRAILTLQGDDLDVAPYRRTAAMVCARVRAALAMVDGRDQDARDFAQLEAELQAAVARYVKAELDRDVDRAQIARMLGLPADPLPPELVLFAMLRARLGGGT